MNTYVIEMKYIKNRESFIMSVLGCIYREVRIVVDESELDGYKHDLLFGFIELVKAFKTIMAYQVNPFEIMKDRYDISEQIDEATKAFVNFQQSVDKFVALFKDSIKIIVIGGTPEYKDEVLPSFGNFIIWN